MNRSLGRITGAATRREILSEDIEMHSKDNLKKTIKKGEVVYSVYTYEIIAYSPKMDFSEQEVVDFENVVEIMFIKYGRKCANAEFLKKKIQEEYPEFNVETISVDFVEVYYKRCMRQGRMGLIEMSSNDILLYLNGDNLYNVNN